MRQDIGRIGVARAVALVAALVLVLQSALAVAAPPVQRDIFGNVICAEGGGFRMSGQGHDGGHMPTCWMLSCGSAFQTTADLPAAAESPAVALVGAGVACPAPRVASSRDRRSPANPRAPPVA